MPYNTVGIWCQNDVVATSMRRDCRTDVNTTSFLHHVPAGKTVTNKTCHRDRIARLTAPCPSHKKTLMLNFLLLPPPTLTPGVVTALPGLRPGELKIHNPRARKTSDKNPTLSEAFLGVKKIIILQLLVFTEAEMTNFQASLDIVSLNDDLAALQFFQFP